MGFLRDGRGGHAGRRDGARVRRRESRPRTRASRLALLATWPGTSPGGASYLALRQIRA
ncbi:hypothetical protein FRACA_1760008 [Frankia canadensis]|uniref:Uncharacterized protein n=1 Tax=Frankia canadensis TaxID=1836972 RepID=A0A2I2KNF1_9ACTN|nr:hypothetical protein FRACA_1760008 [Frankia canadensis]SOU54483.1 hypothetical protein FRACA_1760008 [Frankia canadensis]